MAMTLLKKKMAETRDILKKAAEELTEAQKQNLDPKFKIALEMLDSDSPTAVENATGYGIVRNGARMMIKTAKDKDDSSSD